MTNPNPYDALLILSFGGPQCKADVIPFLENVLRGKNVPRQRLEEVAHHYDLFEGKSPINDQNQALIHCLEKELKQHHIDLPIYFGNRNWHPLLVDTLQKMQKEGVKRALVFVTSVFGSWSGCRQYLQDIALARVEIGPNPMVLDKLRLFYNHPGYIQAAASRLGDAMKLLPQARPARAKYVFTAHSIPQVMADGCAYQSQLHEACKLVCQAAGVADWVLVYQSRSGPPGQPWLEPDIGDYLKQLRAESGSDPLDVILMPIGFISDHMEVVYDLDTEAQELAQRLDIHLLRASTVGTHARFIQMIRQLIEERLTAKTLPLSLGTQGPWPDVCPADCCSLGK